MKTLNKKTTEIFNEIIDTHLNGSNYCKIGKDDGGYMPLVVEKVGSYSIGTMYSFAHYYKVNGDMCQDPEMLFLKHENGNVYPAMFQQAIPPVYQESLFHNGDAWKIQPGLQKEHTSFANIWLKNIEQQQNI